MKPEIKNLKEVASRILKAISSNERIILYGDADLDGATSVIILKESIQNKGGSVTAVYFPDREKEGHGLNEKAVGRLQKYAPALLITLDCGIGNVKEIQQANDLGLEVIVVDHHEILEELPPASLIVDPKQEGDNYPFKEFATAGIAFKLAELIFEAKMPESVRRNFLELVAIATIADMMPKVGENEEMIQEGLSFLDATWRPGLQVLLQLEPFQSLDLLSRIAKINSLLNIRDVTEQLPVSFRILTAQDKAEAQKLAEQCLEKSVERKQHIQEIIADIEQRLSQKPSTPVILEGDSSWDLALLGVVASKLTAQYRKPVFLFKRGPEESPGGVRAPSGVNVVEAMKTCSKILMTYGGHPQAGGFRIKNEHLEEFQKCLNNYFV